MALPLRDAQAEFELAAGPTGLVLRFVATPERLAAFEWALLTLAAPMLLFGGRYAPIGLAPIAAAWIARRLATGRWSAPSEGNRPLLVLLAALLVSLIPSVRLDYSGPKFWGLLLGLAACSAAVNTAANHRTLGSASALLLLCGVAIALVGLLYMAEPAKKLFDSPLYHLLPQLDRRIQSSTVAVWGINANEVGGTVTLLLPLAVVLAVTPGRLRRPAALGAATMVGVLVLTQSRGSIVGVAVALAFGLVWRGGRRGRLAVGAAGLLALGGLLVVLGPGQVVRFARDPELLGRAIGAAGRIELWQRAIAMILDMPFTGIGLNTFPVVALNEYPGYASAEYFDPTGVLPHAHNLYLQTALDLGLVGFGAWLWIVALAAGRGIAAGRAAPTGPLALGLLLGLLAHAIFGLVDAIAPGAKPGPVLWAILGLLLALPPAGSPAQALPEDAARSRFGGWLSRRAALGALLAVPLLLGCAAPLALNLARIPLHRADGRAPADPPLTRTSLDLGRSMAWGPYVARAAAADALGARRRGDLDREIAALDRAVEAGPWDPSLRALLGEALLLRGDLATVDPRGWGVIVDALLRRGRAAPPDAALVLFARARAIDPQDARAYLGAAEVEIRRDRYDEATRLLIAAFRLREPQPWLAALGGRLESSATPLPPLSSVPRGYERDNSVLYARAAELLYARSDPEGGRYAEQLSEIARAPNAVR